MSLVNKSTSGGNDLSNHGLKPKRDQNIPRRCRSHEKQKRSACMGGEIRPALVIVSYPAASDAHQFALGLEFSRLFLVLTFFRSGLDVPSEKLAFDSRLSRFRFSDLGMFLFLRRSSLILSLL